MELENEFLPWKMLFVVGIVFAIILGFAFLFVRCGCTEMKNANNEPKTTEIMSEKTTKTEKQTTKQTEQKNEQGTAENAKSIYFNFFLFALVVAACLCALIICHTQKCIVRNNELKIERLKIESNSAKNNSVTNEFQNSKTKAQNEINVEKAGDKKND